MRGFSRAWNEWHSFFRYWNFKRKAVARDHLRAYTKDSNKTMHYIKSIAERCVYHKLSFHKYHRKYFDLPIRDINNTQKNSFLFNQYSFFSVSVIKMDFCIKWNHFLSYLLDNGFLLWWYYQIQAKLPQIVNPKRCEIKIWWK